MLPYWVLFLLPAWAAMVTRPRTGPAARAGLFLVLFGVALALMIGFRYRVGGDWGFEGNAFLRVRFMNLSEAMQAYDPGFGLMVWLFADTGLNVWTLNTLCGAIFALGLIIFCRHEPHPWLALTIAIPYLVIVVAMGYSRQSVAIGLAMIAMVKLQERKLVSFYIFMLMGATVHTTAVLLIPLGVVASRVNKKLAMIIGGPIFFVAFMYLLQKNVDRFVSGYIDAEYESEGALIRIAMNALPAALFIVLRHRFVLTQGERQLITILSVAALLFIVLLVATPSSTAVDRMALYLIPLQMMVFGRLPLVLARSWREYSTLCVAVVLYSGLVLFVWANYARNAGYWLPYQVFPFEELDGLPDTKG